MAELSFFLDEKGVLSMKIYEANLVSNIGFKTRSNSDLVKRHCESIDVTLHSEHVDRVKFFRQLDVVRRAHDFRGRPSACSSSLDRREFRGFD